MSTKDDALIEKMLQEYWGVFYLDGEDEQDELESAVENMTRAIAVARAAFLGETLAHVTDQCAKWNQTNLGRSVSSQIADHLMRLSTQEQNND